MREEIVAGLLRRRDPETGLIALDPVDVAVGDRVRVFDGPFAGAEGILAERNGERRSLVLLDILGRQAPLEVDAMLLQRVV